MSRTLLLRMQMTTLKKSVTYRFFAPTRRESVTAALITTPTGGTFGKVALAWLNWHLKGDKEAAKMFQGDKCKLCADPQWVTRKKKID